MIGKDISGGGCFQSMPQISRQVLATLVNWSSGTILGSAKFQARNELRPDFITWLVPINVVVRS